MGRRTLRNSRNNSVRYLRRGDIFEAGDCEVHFFVYKGLVDFFLEYASAIDAEKRLGSFSVAQRLDDLDFKLDVWMCSFEFFEELFCLHPGKPATPGGNFPLHVK